MLVSTVLLLLLLIVPVCFAVLTFLDRSETNLVGWLSSLSTVKIRHRPVGSKEFRWPAVP